MTITASGRSALILATGLWIGFAAPSLAAGDATASSKPDSTAAATPDNSAKHGSRHLKKYAHPKSDKPAEKSAADAKAPDAAADDGDHSATMPSSQMPPTVANANAELTSTDTPAGSAKAMSDRVNNILQGKPDNNADAQPAAGTAVVAADQLNDVDRALHEATPHETTSPATPMALASADAPAPAPATSPPVAAASSDNSTWDQTSLIGKIFIGFGALLTMASAARMFMA
jgi:hypothetical protein